MATVNLLLDATCSASFCAADIGGGETYANPTSFKADKVSVRNSMQTADHSTAQDLVELNRKQKLGWEITVETKLYNTALLGFLQVSDLCQISVTAGTGNNIVAKGIITDLEIDYDVPSTLKWTIKAHGTAIVYS